MRFTTIALSSAALATTALAAPAPGWEHGVKNVWHGKGYGGWGKNKGKDYGNPPDNTTCPEVPDFCINDEQADAAANIFRQLIQEYSDELALEALTEDFVDWTSAVNIIRNRGNEGPFQVNGVSFASRQEFMDAQGSQPQIPFETLNTWHGCDVTTTRWQTLRSANGQATEANDIPVVGLGVLKLVPDSENSYGFRVKELYSEFNAAAWLVNLGVFTPTPVSTANPPAATATGAGAAGAPAGPPQKRALPNVGMI